MHVKMDDKVMILAGRDCEMTGDIIAIDRKNGRVKVSRRKMIVKHKKPSQMTQEEGARVEQEAWIDASNVSLFHEEHGAERTGVRYLGKGDAQFATKVEARASFGDDLPSVIQKVRVGKKSGYVYDTPKS